MAPPLMPLVSLSFLLGVAAVAYLVLRVCRREKPTRCALACGYVTTLGLIAVSVYWLGQLHSATRPVLKVIGYPFCGIGILAALAWARPLWRKCGALVRAWRHETAWERCMGGVMALVLLGLALCAFGPPTDADSLDYHLGVPLKMLRDGGFVVSPLWMHSRLVGLGEHLNLLGLAMGTDNLGAVLSLSALVWLLLLIDGVGVNSQRRRLVRVLLLGTPVLLFLVPNQKAQLIGSMALVAAFLYDLERPVDGRRASLSLGAVFFACSLKYSFYAVAIVVLAAMALRLRHATGGQGLAWLCRLVFWYLALLFPLHLFNFLNYHNPVSPFLAETFRDTGGRVAVAFARHLGEYSEGFPFPCNLVVPKSLGTLSTCLGGGVFAFCCVSQYGDRGRRFAWLALASALVVTVLCQHTSRFYVEAYLFAVLAVGAATGLRRWCDKYAVLLVLQMMLVGLLAALGAVTLFPGTWSGPWRDKVMLRSAHEYAAMQALDRMLPEAALVFCDLRSHALMPRPFIPCDYRSYLRNDDYDAVMGEIGEVASHKTFVVMHAAGSLSHPLQPFMYPPVVNGEAYLMGTRNPFNNSLRPLYVYEIDGVALLASLVRATTTAARDLEIPPP